MCFPRQTLIIKLSKVGKYKETWGKAEDHLGGLLNEDQILTIPDTDAVLKKCESHIQWATIENKTGLVATTTDNLEIISLKAKVAQLESNVVINAGPPVKRNHHDNNKKTAPKTIATCTVCQETGHKTEVCWFVTENKIRDAEFALPKDKVEGAPILKTKRATASERKVLGAGVVTNTSNSSADTPYSVTCQLPVSHVPITSVCTTTLYKGYSTTTEALVTTLSLRHRAKTAALDQMFVPHTKDSILDSGSMAPIIEGTSHRSSCSNSWCHWHCRRCRTSRRDLSCPHGHR